MPNSPRVAYASKNRASMVATFFSIVLIIAGVVGLLFVQKPFQESQDIRQKASVEGGLVQVAATPASGANFTVGQQATVDLTVNTQGTQTDGVQLTFNIITDTFDVPTVEVLSGSGLNSLIQEVETTTDGYLITIVATPQLGQPYSTNAPTAVARVTFTPTSAGDIVFNFDPENSISSVYHSNPVRDELKTIAQLSYDATGGTAASPTPTPPTSPSPTPSSSPDPSPTPSVSPSTSPSPSPSSSPGIGGGTIKQCNESCSSNADCAVNLRCYNNTCRLVTNPSSTTCSNPPDQGLSRTCNEYCADTRECATGYSCLQNKCRRADNPDSTTCAAPTSSTQQTIAASCNKACTSNAGCAVNLRCYQGACRLATNPSSTSCSAASSKTVSSLYDQKGGSKGDDVEGDTDKPSTTSSVVKVSPRPSSTPSAIPSPSPEMEEDATFLDTLRTKVPFRLLALIALGVGGLLLLFIILSQLGKRRPPMSPTGMPTAKTPQSTYEQELQAKLDALKKEQPAGPPPSTLRPTPPVNMAPVGAPPAPPEPRPVTPPPVVRPVVERTQPVMPSAAPMTPVSGAPIDPMPPIEPAQSPTETPVFERSSMLQRMKDKGITPPASDDSSDIG